MVREGATHIVVPDPDPDHRGPLARDPEAPFWNPDMALNRDLSVLLVAAYAARRGRDIDVADVLAGAGARSLRIACEVPADLVVHANDADPRAVAAIEAGIEANRIPRHRVRSTNLSAHALLASRRFDVVDVDPYGSPAPFLDAALRATRHDGLLCLTATDTGALAGTYPRVCRRRYGAMPLHLAPWRQEVGLRILLRAAVAAAGRFDRAATPVLSVARGHWMRVVVRVEDGRKGADAARRQTGWVSLGEAGLARLHEDPRTIGPGDAYGGPLWLGPLHDATTLRQMQAAAAGRSLHDPATIPLLDLLLQEAALPPFWLDQGRLQARFGDSPPRDALIHALRSAGFRAGRTHMDPQGIRTDAHLESLQNLWTTLRHRES